MSVLQNFDQQNIHNCMTRETVLVIEYLISSCIVRDDNIKPSLEDYITVDKETNSFHYIRYFSLLVFLLYAGKS